MIKFFRNIRQNLLMQNKTSKYFKYAIGEIILVVIGILIALQINNWNQNRLNKKVETETLVNLKVDLNSALMQVKEKINQNKNFLQLDSLALEHINKRSEIPQDSLQSLLLSHIFTPGFDPELGVLNEILNTGKLDIIQNDKLRNIISSWNKYMDELSEVDERLLYLDDHIKKPFYMKFLPYRNRMKYWYNFYSNGITKAEISKSNFQLDFDKSFYSIELENLLSNYILFGLIQKERLADIKEKIEEMITIIDSETKR